jgi:ACS family allantoate permease-like MFS transporter
VTFVGYCLGNITGPYCFNSTPGPVFTGGFISCVVCVAAVAMVAIYGRWHLARENARRDREFGPVVEGREYVMHDQTDRENRNFRYAL